MSVSHTTRSARLRERDGVDYFFVSRETFEGKIAADEFAEYAEVHGNLYGTAKATLDKLAAEGRDVLLDVDLQGFQSVRREYAMSLVSVFILPPDLESLAERLGRRGSETETQLALRLANAAKEIAAAKNYDYLVVNREVESALAQLQAILTAERCRASRLQQD